MTKDKKKWWEYEYTVNVYPVSIVTYEAPPPIVYTFESDSDEQSFAIVKEQTTITPIVVVDTDPIIIEPEVVYTFESVSVVTETEVSTEEPEITVTFESDPVVTIGESTETTIPAPQRAQRSAEPEPVVASSSASSFLPKQIIGTPEDDTLYGTPNNDYMEGGEGADTLYGYAGDDTLYGGTKTSLRSDGTYVTSASERDRLYGGEGNDYLVAYNGYVKLYGGEGDDILVADRGDNHPRALLTPSLTGGSGVDTFDLRSFEFTKHYEWLGYIGRFWSEGGRTQITIKDLEPGEKILLSEDVLDKVQALLTEGTSWSMAWTEEYRDGSSKDYTMSGIEYFSEDYDYASENDGKEVEFYYDELFYTMTENSEWTRPYPNETNYYTQFYGPNHEFFLDVYSFEELTADYFDVL